MLFRSRDEETRMVWACEEAARRKPTSMKDVRSSMGIDSVRETLVVFAFSRLREKGLTICASPIV